MSASGAVSFACPCLNIQINGEDPSQDGQDLRHSSQVSCPDDYQLIVVDETGILVAHSELTLRTRSAIVAASDESGIRHFQDVFVSCLVCDTITYFVKTEAAPDVEGNEGPILPSDDWVDREVMSSKEGQIYVHTGRSGCISGEAIKRTASLESFSPVFSVCIPENSSDIPAQAPSLASTKFKISPEHTFLPDLPSFLPPPPFTPPHPIFVHISAVAEAHASAGRLATEKRIGDYTRQQLMQLEHAETTLKRQLERLWVKVRESIVKVDKKRTTVNFESTKLKRQRSLSIGARSFSAFDDSSSSTVHNFVPSTPSGHRRFSLSPIPQSALSASLADRDTYPSTWQRSPTQGECDAILRTRQSSRSPPPYASSPSSRPDVPDLINRSINISQSLKRNMDAANDTAVTFRWYAIKEREEQERRKHEVPEENEAKSERLDADASVEAKRKGTANTTDDVDLPLGPAEADDKSAKNRQIGSVVASFPSNRNADGRRGRKVKFDVEPDVASIEDRLDDEYRGAFDDLIFEIEYDDEECSNDSSKVGLSESRSVEKRDSGMVFEVPRRPMSGLHQLPRSLGSDTYLKRFLELRPSSLPSPSNILPTTHLHSAIKYQSRPSTQMATLKLFSRRDQAQRLTNHAQDEGVQLYQNLRGLVAADSPSHRGAWSHGTTIRKFFDQQRDSSIGVNQVTSDNADATDEGLDSPSWEIYQNRDIPSSLPLPMASSAFLKLHGTARHLQKPFPSEQEHISAVPSSTRDEESASENRRKAYAERDRLRGMDPGVLDYMLDIEGAEPTQEEVASTSTVGNEPPTSRSLQHALRILEARNSVPAEGLWRSLAA